MGVSLTKNDNRTGHAEESVDINPMLIPVILDLIIQYLPFDHLKSCRLISKLWNETVTSSKEFKSKSKNSVVFGYHKKYDFLDTNFYPVRDMVKLGNCIKSPLRTGNFPLHTFIVVTSGTRNDTNFIESILRDFLSAISPVAQKLVIEYDREFVPVGKIRAANWGVFPKLKYLKLKLGEPQVQIIWKFLEHIMGPGNAPLLEKLHIRWKLRSIPDSYISKLISTIHVPTTTSKLKSLKMKCPLQLPHLIEFKALELNLRELHIELNNISHLEAASTVRSILERQSKTLCRLKIIDWQDQYQIVQTKVDIFPKLSNLETLIIFTARKIFADNLRKERFPRLKSLTFTGSSSPWTEFFGKEIQPILSVNELKVTELLFNRMILHTAVLYFPNITKLQIPAVSNMTNVVFDKMSQIEELTLDTTNILCIDDIITGMTLEECKDALGGMTDWRKNIEVLESIRDVRLTTKPISCLTKLKTLRLLSMDYALVGLEFRKKKMEITKLSYLMVLLSMDSLRCIDFGVRRFLPNYQLQPSVWRRVSEKFKILCATRRPQAEIGP